MNNKVSLYLVSIVAIVGLVGIILMLTSSIGSESRYAAYTATDTDKIGAALAGTGYLGADLSSPSVVSTNTTINSYVPFLIGIGETAPSSDVVLATDILQKLQTKGLIQTGGDVAITWAKLFGEINALQLDNRVTLAIYNGAGIIIVGSNSPATHVLFAQELSSILSSKGMSVKTIVTSSITSSNLMDLFKIPSTCTDTDNGKNYYVMGSVTYNYGSRSTISNDQSTVSDYCSGNNVNEAFCFADTNGIVQFGWDGISCPNGCSNGACIQSTNITPACTDSDGGLNTFVKGHTIGFKPQAAPGYQNGDTWDVCVKDSSDSFNSIKEEFKNNLYEYGCRDGYFYSEMHTCMNGCSNGACIQSTTPACTDSDGGQNIYVKGQISNPNTGAVAWTDICINKVYYGPGIGTDGYQYETTSSCGANEFCFIGEATCNANQNWGGVAGEAKNIPCPNGCSNGACIQTTTPACTDSDNTPDISRTYIGPSDILAGKYPSVYVKGKGTGIYLGGSPDYPVIYGTEPNPDTAKPSSYGYSVYYDYCVSATQLNEAFCTNAKLGAAGITCPNGCSDGACIAAPTPSLSCRELENTLVIAQNPFPSFTRIIMNKGKNLEYVNGLTSGKWNISLLGGNNIESTILISVNGNIRTVSLGKSIVIGGLMVVFNGAQFTSDNIIDAVIYVYPNSLITNNQMLRTISEKLYCKGNSVYQRECPAVVTETSDFKETLIGNCPNGCSNGACIQSTNITPACTDSDGGKNYVVKGYISGGDRYGNGNPGGDYCGSDPEGKILMEGFCDSGYVNFISYSCPNGCSNGICLQSLQENITQIDLRLDEIKYVTFNGQTISLKLVFLDDVTGIYAIEVNGRWVYVYNYNMELPIANYVSIKGLGYTNINAASKSVVLQLQKNNYILTNKCTDTDNGRTYGKAGKVTYNGQTYSDYCKGSQLFEYVCENEFHSEYNIAMAGLSYDCPNGCSDGACVNSPCIMRSCARPPEGCTYQNPTYDSNRCMTSCGQLVCVNVPITCTDSDNGKDYYDRGTIHGIQENGNIEVTSTDFCMEDGKGLIEYYCKGHYVLIDYPSCTAGCQNGACIKNFRYNLSDYPRPFITNDRIATALFVIGRNAKADDIIGANDIVASLQRYVGTTPLSNGLVKFDDELSLEDIENRDLILVGGMCANSVVSEIYGSPSVCTSRDKKGVGKIEIMPNKNPDRFILLVHGYDAEDTTMATRVLANWENYIKPFSGATSLCVTGTLNNMQVAKC